MMKRHHFAAAALLPGLFALSTMVMGQDEQDAFSELAGDDLEIMYVDEVPEESDSVAQDDEEAMTDDQDDGESVNVDLEDSMRSIQVDASSVEELQRLLNTPSSGTLREYQEDPENPRSIFSTDEEVVQILGERPEFIYFPEGVDPMIIPWVRARIASQEMWQEANLATANSDYDKAIALLRELRERFPETESGERAPAEIERVIRTREQANRPQIAVEADLPVAPEEEEAVLPEWVKENTTGILIGSTPMVIVGNDFLAEGDPVPRFASVRVKSIEAAEVVYVYQDKDFVVEVVGTF